MKYIGLGLVVGLLPLLLEWPTPTYGCHGMGSGLGRRKPGRSMVPFVYKQHIPNMSEGTIGASGPAEGRIRRTDERFNTLVLNYNPQVVFKDEEGTDADHRMSKRCKDRVDTLALLVANHWPSVKLRVTEAWDEDGDRKSSSLHYEGRAVDLTTDDVDHEKYGMLARLAVEAGFDWVFYESRYHVHASVVADDSETASYGGCFPAESFVTLEDGRVKAMEELQIADRVLTVDTHTGEAKASDVILLMHKDESAIAEFVDITVSPNEESRARVLTLTPGHLIHVQRKYSNQNWQRIVVYAGDVVAGDRVYVRTDSSNNNATKVITASVASIRSTLRRGLYAPLTLEGTILVNNVLASCYAVFPNEQVSHALFWPVRTLWNFASHAVGFYGGSDSGIHWYPRHVFDVASFLLPKELLRTS